MHPVDIHLANAVLERGDKLYVVSSFQDPAVFFCGNGLALHINDTHFHIPSHQASGMSMEEYMHEYANLLYSICVEEEIDCILPSAATDMILPCIGAVNDKLGLPGITGLRGDLFSSKSWYMEELVLNGVHVPVLLERVEPGKMPSGYDYQYPVICKPDHGSGSKGIFVARDEVELRWFFGPSDRPQDFSPAAAAVHDRLEDGSLRNYLYHGEGGPYLVENFFLGPCISIGGTVEEAGLTLDCIHKVDVTPLPYRSETGFRFSPAVSDELQARAQELATKLPVALPFPTGAWRVDCIWTGEELVVVDLAPRMCTTASQALAYSTDHLTDYAHGVIEASINGNRTRPVNPTKTVRCKVMDLPKGKVKSYGFVDGKDDVDHWEMAYEPPDKTIYEARNDYQSWGRGWALANGYTMEEVDAKLTAFFDDFKVEMEP